MLYILKSIKQHQCLNGFQLTLLIQSFVNTDFSQSIVLGRSIVIYSKIIIELPTIYLIFFIFRSNSKDQDHQITRSHHNHPSSVCSSDLISKPSYKQQSQALDNDVKTAWINPRIISKVINSSALDLYFVKSQFYLIIIDLTMTCSRE